MSAMALLCAITYLCSTSLCCPSAAALSAAAVRCNTCSASSRSAADTLLSNGNCGAARAANAAAAASASSGSAPGPAQNTSAMLILLLTKCAGRALMRAFKHSVTSSLVDGSTYHQQHDMTRHTHIRHTPADACDI